MSEAAEHSKAPRIRLYVAGNSPSSLAAREIVDACIPAGADGPDYELIDVLRHPERALAANLIATPTLILDDGGHERRYVGDLRRQTGLQNVLRGLGATPEPEA